MTSDEIQAAINRALTKRGELQGARSEIRSPQKYSPPYREPPRSTVNRYNSETGACGRTSKFTPQSLVRGVGEVVVGREGLEPSTKRLRVSCSTN